MEVSEVEPQITEDVREEEEIEEYESEESYSEDDYDDDGEEVFDKYEEALLAFEGGSSNSGGGGSSINLTKRVKNDIIQTQKASIREPNHTGNELSGCK